MFTDGRAGPSISYYVGQPAVVIFYVVIVVIEFHLLLRIVCIALANSHLVAESYVKVFIKRILIIS